jgi:virulence factor Mce-like protein
MIGGGPKQRRSALAANPVLIGAATALIAIVAVVLAYNANSGLPFVRTYDIRAEVPDAAGLIVGNDVRKGGSRVGFVSAIVPRKGDDGTRGATIEMKLDMTAKPIPADSRVDIRPRSALGLKYVQLTEGRSGRDLAAGATIPLRYAGGKPVELDDLFNTFDEPTREASGENLVEFGSGLAGRGESLNEAVRDLKPLLTSAEPALRNLVARPTGFDRIFPALQQTAAEVAPVAGSQADFITALRRTFTALDRVRPAIQDSISFGPRALNAGIEELPRQADFLNASTELFRRLRPAFSALTAAAPGLGDAFAAGTPALRRSPALNRRLTRTLGKLEDFGADERTFRGMGSLKALAEVVRPTAAYVAPAQSVCNYLTLLTRNLGSTLSESDTVGPALRTGLLILPNFPDGESGPSAKPAAGPAQNLRQAKPKYPSDSLLHSNPYPNTAAPGQPKECEAGNEIYAPGRQMIGNTPANEGLVTEGQKVGAK